MKRLEKLTAILASLEQEDYPVHSRVHTMRMGREEGVACYVKREDELGCLISGSKIRKYRTQLASLKKRGCQHVGLIGSQFSNHILGLSSLLIENQITPTLFLRKAKTDVCTGNALFLRTLVPEANIQWTQADEAIEDWQKRTPHSAIVPEGGSYEGCIGGLVTLALDIVANEGAAGVEFKEIIIDSGSGLTAASLIAAFGYLEKKAHIHVMLAASDEKSFLGQVAAAKEALAGLTLEREAGVSPFTVHKPPTAHSFGATNRAVFEAIVACGRSEGFLLDPLYSSKLYLLLGKLITGKVLKGPVLFIHSGGLFALSGFQQELLKLV
ncbi:MAG: hypothetical protein JSR46_02815 [Verrucomicrobia bacterium]|nr:hypothetical protein [Verrucomicrobiota bacterium]